MLPTLVRRLAQAAKPHIEAVASPSKLKKKWPPDFKSLPPQEQLRFEKRYKRRVNHIAQRPRWNKIVRLAQYSTIIFVVIYSVLFMDWRDERQPFDEVRKWFWEFLGFEAPEPKPKKIGAASGTTPPTR
ncbi:hypothetical protein B0T25DRAFT_572650 [Lasiosphaeria hispida]|uniref:Uncharacterized protein n=1 Tax=Lasiosphaeria hispida TaxID=260671 RepID=A0AAJ0H8A5_9PEZI|nr:hypothetical protein B0T25DRAFT_572650 [Lasiosphaeria hispida]